MSKIYDCGMIVGRFQNFHLGHVKLIDTALSLCDRVLVLIGSAQESGTERNPFDTQTRAGMIRSVFEEGSGVLLHSIADIDDEDGWGNHLLTTCSKYFHKPPDLFVYGSDMCQQNLWFTDEQMYKTSQMIVSRAGIPISGTMARGLLKEGRRTEWMEIVHPKLHKYYDSLRAEITNLSEEIK